MRWALVDTGTFTTGCHTLSHDRPVARTTQVVYRLKMTIRQVFPVLSFAAVLLAAGCSAPEGLAESQPADVTVMFDFDALPLPEIPLPNDIATRPDSASPTGRRVNASMFAPTVFESEVRELIDGLDGWGLQMPISIPFSGPIDVQSILDGHRDHDYRTDNDVIYLIDIDRDSPDYGTIHPLDFGNGNYPVVLESPERYGPNDPHIDSLSLVFEETDEDIDGNGEITPGEVDENRNGEVDASEDLNGNGYLDPPEDTDADGILDKPNYYPGANPPKDDLAARADALMTFYEKESHTVIAQPMEPLRERTTYAVVVTRRLLDEDGDPVGSPFNYINHIAQTEQLRPLMGVMPEGLDVEDIAFTFAFTTETAESDWVAVRDGLDGRGVQSHIAEEFPPELDKLHELKITDDPAFPQLEGRSPFQMYTEDWISAFAIIADGLLGAPIDSQRGASLVGSHAYVDYHVMGEFTAPQLFARFDENGERLGLNQQSWPTDLDRLPAETRGETIQFWLVMPRKENSLRGEDKQVPVVLLGHGYGGNRIGETLAFSGFMAQFGIATLAIDNVSHGLALPQDDTDLAQAVLDTFGVGPVGPAIQLGRAEDLDGDGEVDSGADFWTSYLFHTRDMMRQSALDYSSLIRIVRQWDGETTWDLDIGDGGGGLGGDFDGDGVVDIGAESPVYAMGGSLGGIMSTILGGAEPEVDAITPIAGGGRLADVGLRSRQSGVPQAVIMRIMGPLYTATLNDDGTTAVNSFITVLNRTADLPLATVDGLLPGDTMVVENLDNGEVGCAYLLPDEEDNGVSGRARVGVGSDLGDRTEIRFYRGPSLVLGSEECELMDGVEPIAVVDRLGQALSAEGRSYGAGSPLVAMAEGLGLRRTHPELRRFMGLGQMVLDPADPAVFARHFRKDPLTFESTGETVSTNAMIITTVGDMAVPASSGLTVGRAAGYIPYTEVDERYAGTEFEGMSSNDIVIASYNAEAVNGLNRFTMNDDPEGMGVHMDIENFSGGTDLWGDSIPRLDPPLRLMTDVDDDGEEFAGLGGAIFTYAVPEGQHGFAQPGEQTDAAIQACEDSGGMDCDELVGPTFDVGWYMFHSIGRFLGSGGTLYPFQDGCNTLESCNDLPEAPAARDQADLP